MKGLWVLINNVNYLDLYMPLFMNEVNVWGQGGDCGLRT